MVSLSLEPEAAIDLLREPGGVARRQLVSSEQLVQEPQCSTLAETTGFPLERKHWCRCQILSGAAKQRSLRPGCRDRRRAFRRAEPRTIGAFFSSSPLPHVTLNARSMAVRSTCGSPRARSRSSIAGSASAPISAATWAVSTAPTPITCPAPTGVTPSGRRIGSAGGPARSGRTPKA
jgi:hypothetical protein